ncbi:cob(I)yrinic acid a,c-diamide adenosyltransferase [bacterium]|nr:cob(I)yrinic acid a,c-diamide adenosyltransferase [candidate division CSSED10-310 bacterium]
MKIYTRMGDDGTTRLYSGERVSKCHPRIEACGAVDELNAAVGMLMAGNLPEKPVLTRELTGIQNRLIEFGSRLATSAGSPSRAELDDDWIASIERAIDRMDELLPELKAFILPGGCENSARAQMCRVICRRAERHVVRLMDENHGERADAFLKPVLAGLNRLSDYFFVLARYLNMLKGFLDVERAGD